MTQALEGVTADNRTASTTHVPDGRASEHRARVANASLPPHAGQTPSANSASMPTAQIISLPDMHADVHDTAAGRRDGAPILQDWNPLHQIKATLQVCVGEATLSVGELLAAKEHQVLRLDRGVDQPVDLTIEGKVVARGQVVAVDGHFAVRITELPVALGLATGA